MGRSDKHSYLNRILSQRANNKIFRSEIIIQDSKVASNHLINLREKQIQSHIHTERRNPKATKSQTCEI